MIACLCFDRRRPEVTEMKETRHLDPNDHMQRVGLQPHVARIVASQHYHMIVCIHFSSTVIALPLACLGLVGTFLSRSVVVESRLYSALAGSLFVFDNSAPRKA